MILSSQLLGWRLALVPRRAPRRVPATVRLSAELPGQEDFYVERLGNGVASGSRRDLLGNFSIAAYDLKTWLLELIHQGLASHASQITRQVQLCRHAVVANSRP